jgi:hypothetical protein
MVYRKLDLLPYCLKIQVIPNVKLGYNQYFLSENATHSTITWDIPVSPLWKYVNTQIEWQAMCVYIFQLP